MAVSKTVIDIYEDSALTSLQQTVETIGTDNPVLVETLSPGKHYWATIVATENGQDSPTSPGYHFATLPDAQFEGAPTTSGTTAYFQVETFTNGVGIDRCGCAWSLSTQFTSPTWDWTNQGSITNLQEGTAYYLWAVVQDEYGRVWRNPAYETVAIGYAVPEVRINEIVAYSDTARGMIDVRSQIPVDAVGVRLLPSGGGSYIDATVPNVGTGVQQWTAVSLTPDTQYGVYASAHNASGTGTATSQLHTTVSGNAVRLDDAAVNASDPYHSIYVEVQGITDSGAAIERVGAKAFLSNDHTGTPSASADGQYGSDWLSENLWGLMPATTYWVFAYMNYTVNGLSAIAWSEGQPVTTSALPTPVINVSSVTDITPTAATAVITIS